LLDNKLNQGILFPGSICCRANQGAKASFSSGTTTHSLTTFSIITANVLNVVKLNVIMLNVIILSVVAVARQRRSADVNPASKMSLFRQKPVAQE
jgi:hypothetical protein